MTAGGVTASASRPVPDLAQELGTLFGLAAREADGPIEKTYLIADLGVRIRYARREMLERIGPALAHLEREGIDHVLLTIDAWDSANARAATPPLPTPDPAAVPGSKYYFEEGPTRGSYMPASGALSVLDTEARHGWYWVEDPAEMPDWEAAASIRLLLHWWLPDHGAIEVHGGAVGTESGGVLVVGRGGSGKSTTCLASVGHPELRYVSDDYTAIRFQPEPWAYSLYSSGKLEPGHAKRLPHLATAVANEDRLHLEEKAVFYVHEHFAGSIVPGFLLRAVLVPRIVPGRRETRVVKASPAAALSALAPSTVFQLHPPTPETFRTMARLLAAVPSFHLELGSDIDAIPQAILDLLADLER